MPSRINNIFGKTEVFRRFRLEGESDGWAFYFLDLPKSQSGETKMTSQTPNPALLHTQLPDALFAQYTAESVNKLAATDKLEIIEKLHLLELIFDTRRYEIMDAILTEDFVMDHALAKRLDRASFKQLWQDNEAVLLNGIRHQLTNVIVYPNHDETATAIAYLNVLKFANTSTLSKTDNPVLLAHAVQVVQFRKENGVWKLAHLTIDQMAVSDIFGLDKATGHYFAALAGEREQLGQPLF